MSSHEKDELGYPVDPELKRLESRLGALAARYRSHKSPEKDKAIVQEYHLIMEQRYQLGWDGVLDVEGELPDELMPRQYLERNPLPGDS